jgi:hypothetical protein
MANIQERSPGKWYTGPGRRIEKVEKLTPLLFIVCVLQLEAYGSITKSNKLLTKKHKLNYADYAH